MDVIMTTQISLMLTVYTDFKTVHESQKFTGSNKFSHMGYMFFRPWSNPQVIDLQNKVWSCKDKFTSIASNKKFAKIMFSFSEIFHKNSLVQISFPTWILKDVFLSMK